jgi:hypothetical protein
MLTPFQSGDASLVARLDELLRMDKTSSEATDGMAIIFKMFYTFTWLAHRMSIQVDLRALTLSAVETHNTRFPGYSVRVL